MKTIVFDIDGTLSDDRPRIHLLKEKDWDNYHAKMEEDEPILHILTLAKEFAQHYSIGIITGRPERYEFQTRRWLEFHGLLWQFMDMRPEKDFRPNHEVKRDALRNFRDLGCQVVLAFDDNAEAVKMYQEQGVPTVYCQRSNFTYEEMLHVSR